jgi:hypothetical protein
VVAKAALVPSGSDDPGMMVSFALELPYRGRGRVVLQEILRELNPHIMSSYWGQFRCPRCYSYAQAEAEAQSNKRSPLPFSFSRCPTS